jgi:hypothetical protein
VSTAIERHAAARAKLCQLGWQFHLRQTANAIASSFALGAVAMNAGD